VKNIVKHTCVLLFYLMVLPVVIPYAFINFADSSGNSNQGDVPIVRDRDNFIYYYDHGAIGDGITCDFDAIVRAHEAANRLDKPVRADYSKTYFISGKRQTAIIQTDTDWRNAVFIIDERNLEDRHSRVFRITSRYEAQPLGDYVISLTRGQANIGRTFTHDSLIFVEDANTRRFIRRGRNEDTGQAQREVFLIDKDGNVDPSTPILWDYEQITSSAIRPIDTNLLTVKGGRFITMPGELCLRGLYQWRSIQVERSNTLVYGLRHDVVNDNNAPPHMGFVLVMDAANVTIKNSYFTGRRRTIHGSYGIYARRAINLFLNEVRQTNDINDSRYWGIFASNESKNITFDEVTLSRFDAHRGVHNATIKNSVLGHQGISIIGSGLLTVENTTVSGSRFINLRSDYGSTWNGEIIIRNSVFHPSGNTAQIIDGSNDGSWDFGYQTYLPTVVIEGLRIIDWQLRRNDNALRLFARFEQIQGARYRIMYPHDIIVNNLIRDSGYGFITSLNADGKFENVTVTIQ